MQKTRTSTPVYLIALPVIASCVLRFFLLLDYTDKETGYVVEGNNLPFFIYAVITAIIAIVIWTSKDKNDFAVLLDFEYGSKKEYFVAVFLAVTFFADFLHQGYNCYDYLSGVSYVEYVYIIPLLLSALLALICSFYYFCFAMTANGSNYDFRNLTFFHFAPVVWSFIKLIMMMLKIIDIRLGVESMLEFMLVSFLAMFFFSFISMLDNDGIASRMLVIFADLSFLLSIILVLPRFAIILSGNADVLSEAKYSGINYIALGIFAITLSARATKKD